MAFIYEYEEDKGLGHTLTRQREFTDPPYTFMVTKLKMNAHEARECAEWMAENGDVDLPHGLGWIYVAPTEAERKAAMNALPCGEQDARLAL